MNLSIISHQFNPMAGGIERIAFLLTDELSKTDRVTIVSPPGRQDRIDNQVSSLSFRKVEDGLLKSLISILRIYLEKLRHSNYNIVMIHTLGIGALGAKMLRGTPYCVLVYGNDVYGNVISKNKLANLVLLKYRKMVLEHANAVVADSGYAQALCYRIMSRKRHNKITVIHPPIKFQPSASVSELNHQTMFSIGRLVERKGFHNVVKAMPDILHAFPDLKYILAGEGPYRLEIEKLVSDLHLQKNVKLVGKISDEQKDIYFDECSFYIMPSFDIPESSNVEGFGIVYLEANMHGKFVIASDTGGCSDAVVRGITGCLIAQNDVNDIVSNVIKFLSGGFTYTPKNCIAWAQEHDISLIANHYRKLLYMGIVGCK